jgi:polysaccharide pyruvyl transferase WcaK-like protein
MAILEHADMLIGMRLHSLVLATATGVPSVAIGFDMKVGGFMRYLGIGEYCHPIGEFTAEQLIESTERCWQDRTRLRKRIEDRMREWRTLIDDAMTELATIVDG